MSAPVGRENPGKRLPLLFLDIDGVVLPVGGDIEELGFELGRQLAALPAELVWATAWEHEANEEVAPRLGLAPLPVVEWPDSSDEREVEDAYFGLHWKTRALVEWAAGRDFAWVDDELTDADRAWVEANHPGRALLHRVHLRRGLTDRDLAVLSRWLGASTPRT